jgi:hypothetical protein
VITSLNKNNCAYQQKICTVLIFNPSYKANTKSREHRLNTEPDLQSIFGLMSCVQLYSLAETRVLSFETSFDSKQPNWNQSYAKQTVCFGCFASVQTEEQPKHLDREHILVFLSENLGLFLLCFGLFSFVSKQFVSVVSLLYQNREFQCFD